MRIELPAEECLDIPTCLREWNNIYCTENNSDLDLDYLDIPACFRSYDPELSEEIELSPRFQAEISEYFPPVYDEDFLNVPTYIRNQEVKLPEQAANDQCRIVEIDIDDFERLNDVLNWRRDKGYATSGIESVSDLLDCGVSRENCHKLTDLIVCRKLSEKSVVLVYLLMLPQLDHRLKTFIRDELADLEITEQSIVEIWSYLI